MKTTAAVVDAPGAPFRLEDLDLDALRDDEVLVELVACGICHTDLTARAGGFPTPFPVVLGHEGAGRVAAVGAAVAGVAPGDRVVLSFASCGACPTCADGHPSACHEFAPRNFGAARRDGTTPLRAGGGAAVHAPFFGQSAFATHAICPERAVIRVADDDMPFALLATLGCGVQTGAGAVLNVLAPRPGATIAIAGCGAVGLSAVMAARIAGCAAIVAIDVHPERLALARELGATSAVDASAGDVPGAVRAVLGAGADFTLECSGSPAALVDAIAALGPRGTCGVIGAPPFGTLVGIDPNLLLDGSRTVRGIVEGDSVTERFIPELVGRWRAGELPVERLVRTYPFAQINEAVADMERGAVVKPVLLHDPREAA